MTRFPPICAIHWQDACTREGTFTLDEITGTRTGHRLDRVELLTVGWLVHETNDTITLAKDYDADENKWRDLVHIPIGMVLSKQRFIYGGSARSKRTQRIARPKNK